MRTLCILRAVAELSKAHLADERVPTDTAFAAVLGIPDHGLATAAQKLALFRGGKGRSHRQACIQALEMSDKIGLVQERGCRNEDSGVLELHRVIFGRDGLVTRRQCAHAFSDCVPPRDRNSDAFNMELRN